MTAWVDAERVRELGYYTLNERVHRLSGFTEDVDGVISEGISLQEQK